MSIAFTNGSGKVDSLVSISEEFGQLVERAVHDRMLLRAFERNLFDRLLEIGFATMQQFLAMQGDGDRGETAADEEGRTLHRSEQATPRRLRTIFGEHQFEAHVYRRRKHPNTPIALRPVDAQLGIGPDRFSPLLQEFTMLFAVEQSFEPAADAFDAIFRQRLSVDTLERVSRRMGEQAGGFLDALEPPPADEEGELLVQTADGKGVPLVREDATKLRSFEEKPKRPGNRRMATLAGVYSVDRHIRTPEQIVEALFRDERDAAPPEKPSRPKPCHKHLIARFSQVIEEVDETEPIPGSLLALSWASREVEQRRREDQMLIRLMDGQHSLWNTAETCCEVPAKQVVEILDVVHVSSYVWRAAKVLHSHREHQEAFARERLLRIVEGDVKSVIAGLRRMATQRHLRGSPRNEIDTVCGYFEAHRNRMQYDDYLAAGYPIATGVIEGACRHLVKDRMERSGMRWTLEGAQAMLNLRALRQSSWEEFHQRPHSTTTTPLSG